MHVARAASLAGLILCTGLAFADEPPTRYDAAAWRADLAALERGLEQRYAHLGWLASGRGGVDLVAAHAAVERELAAAGDDEAARLALERFVASFHDGHLQPLRPASAVAGPGPADPCEALGVEAADRPAPSFPAASLPGLVSASAADDDFPTAVVDTPHGRRLALLRIAGFTPTMYPGLCRRVLQDFAARQVEPTKRRVRDAMQDRWIETLAQTVKRLAAARPDALVVDVAHNFGGGDLGDWTVRLLTPAPVRSAPLLVEADAAGAYLDAQLRGLRRGLSLLHDDPPALAARFREAIGAFELRRERLASRSPCAPMSWAWHEQRPWTPGLCDGLVEAGFASGAYDYLPPGAPALADIAAYAYWPAQVDAFRGTWSGPLYVYADGQDWSAAEMFVAALRDNRVGRIVGTRTGGAGCGNMGASRPLELPHSGLRFQLPDCVRLRADGSDEVAGVAPDIAFEPVSGEADAARAARFIRVIERDLTTRRPGPPAPQAAGAQVHAE